MCKFQGHVIFFKRDIQPRGIFMTLGPTFFPKNPVFRAYKFVNSKKNTSGWKIFFLRIPSPRILRQVGEGQISRSWYFFKRDIQPRAPRGISAKVPDFVHDPLFETKSYFKCLGAYS